MITRRQAFQKLALAAGSITSLAHAGFEFVDACVSPKTPKQPEGPFYPVVGQSDKDTDLTRVVGQSAAAKGAIIYVTGSILDRLCVPISGASVEIWQACATGRYNHPGDESGLELDEHFQYWGIAHSDAAGNYGFKTILPGSYPAGNNWIRPPHIHYKVAKLGFHELITQLYFEGNPHNEKDLILQGLPAADRPKVVRRLIPGSSGMEPGSQSVEFSITLDRVV